MSLDTAPGITTRKTWLSICSQRRCTLCRIEVHIRHTCPSTDDPHNVRGDLDQPKTLNAQNTYPFTRHLLRVMIWPGGLVVPHTRRNYEKKQRSTCFALRHHGLALPHHGAQCLCHPPRVRPIIANIGARVRTLHDECHTQSSLGYKE